MPKIDTGEVRLGFYIALGFFLFGFVLALGMWLLRAAKGGAMGGRKPKGGSYGG